MVLGYRSGISRANCGAAAAFPPPHRTLPMPRRTEPVFPVRRYWLVKSEPDVFSFDDLWAAPDRTTGWDGVRNYQARNFMRDEMKVGDGVLFYHSGAEPPGVAGVAEVVREAYPDPSALDPANSYRARRRRGSVNGSDEEPGGERMKASERRR
jgi:hypothetical protein